jgi:hypothetical protein
VAVAVGLWSKVSSGTGGSFELARRMLNAR